uniref:SGNH hydrolase-type esterase domain-containing protein n=1 Tax=Salix viminalis TaxID=40686 RepID=A0A6N2MHW0_SALVM
MDRQQQFLLYIFSCFSFLLLLSENTSVYGSSHHHHHRHRHLFDFRPSKLFVFGDSYVDTGNSRKSLATSWKVPYGITFPGKPAGRFSDGRVLTDFLAKSIGIKSPISYRWRKVAGIEHWKNGMNFAYTLLPDNMTQIDFFQDIIHEKFYSGSDLHSSVALVSVAGNDYSNYIATNGSTQGWQPFITKVVNQLVMNIETHSMAWE